MIVPVIDLQEGQVVRGRGGHRETYEPIPLTGRSLQEYAQDLLDRSQADALYVADLDAIRGRGTQQQALWQTLAEVLTVDLFVDVGLRTPEDVRQFPDQDRLIPILGTETMAGPATALAARDRGEACAVSLDLFQGRLLGPWQAWQPQGIHDDQDLATLAHAATTLCDASVLIVLDLASVGMNQGPLAEAHWPAIRQAMRYRQGELWLGGGIRDQADVDRLAHAGVDAVLSSSALLAGRLTPNVPSLQLRSRRK